MLYNKEIIEETIEKMNQSISIIQSEVKKASTLISSIQEDWKGEPSNYLATNMRISFNDFDSYIEVLDNYKEYLEDVIEDINYTEKNSTKIINDVLGG